MLALTVTKLWYMPDAGIGSVGAAYSSYAEERNGKSQLLSMTPGVVFHCSAHLQYLKASAFFKNIATIYGVDPSVYSISNTQESPPPKALA